MLTFARRRAFTLIEVLVVIGIIGVLIGLLLPALNMAREAARQADCRQRLRQLGLAIHGYANANSVFPPSACIDLHLTTDSESWSVHARLLPYLEQGNVYRRIDLTQSWSNQYILDQLSIPAIVCPSDPHVQRIRVPTNNRPRHFPTSYGFCQGTWFIYDPASDRQGDGAFHPNAHFTFAAIKDGTSQTLMAADVKSWTPTRRTGGPENVSVPNTVADVESLMSQGTVFRDNGHTEWFDGIVHHAGFTTTLVPNASPRCSDGATMLADCNYNSWQEGIGGGEGRPTYSATTARSCHPRMVSVLLMDGSCRAMPDAIALPVWRSLGTRRGGETMQESWH